MQHVRVAVWILLVFAALAISVQPVHAQEMHDVVYLRDGSVIRGTIVEQIPGVSILIETRDGSRFRYQLSEIDRMTREPRTERENPIMLKNPGVAGLLSAVIPGAGQVYNGRSRRGAAFFLGLSAIYLSMSSACHSGLDCWTGRVVVAGYIGVYAWNIVDAVMLSNGINDEGVEFQMLPEIRPGHGERFPSMLPALQLRVTVPLGVTR